MVFTSPVVQFAPPAPCALWVGQIPMRDELNCAGMGGGVLSVTTFGTALMLELSVSSLAWDQVSQLAVSCQLLVITLVGSTRRNAFFGRGSGSVLMDNVRCNGTEQFLTNCTHNTNHYCGHNKDAGVKCTCKYNSIMCTTFSIFYLCNAKMIRGLVCMHLAHINSWTIVPILDYAILL